MKNLIEIEDYNGNTLYLINLEITDNKITSFKAVNNKNINLDLADEEENNEIRHIRLQEVEE
tara:strand:+ start:256 stop:441 length:186 start_codon:yes stop_codon:yes gene_type:complete